VNRKEDAERLLATLRAEKKRKEFPPSTDVVEDGSKKNAHVGKGSKRKKKRCQKRMNIDIAVSSNAQADAVPSNNYVAQEDDVKQDDVEVDDREQYNKEEWYWDEEYATYVYVGPKRARRKDLSNKKEKTWRLGVSRNWETEKKAKLIKKITLKRNELHMVRPCTSAPQDVA
jgi:hypothetical protein